MRHALRGINARILIVPLLAVAALAGVGFVSVHTIRDVTLAEHEARARVIVESAIKIVDDLAAKAARGEMTQDAAQALAKELIRAIRYDGNEYVMARDASGTILAHGMIRTQEGKNTMGARDANGTYYGRDMVDAAKAGGGFSYYLWPKTAGGTPVRKSSYSKFADAWGWIISSGIYLDDVEAAAWNSTMWTLGAVIGLAALTFGLALLIGRSIARPITGMTGAMQELAGGNAAIDIPGAGRRDEIGAMAASVRVFKERMAEADRLRAEREEAKARTEAERTAAMGKLAGDFEASIKGVVDMVSSASGQLQTTAQSMSSTAEETARQTTAVAAASEQASSNVQTVAGSAEELSASIAEISRHVADSARIANEAKDQAERTNAEIQGLSAAAQRIGDVVKLITDIAGQTNLLALNATIEAARAGEAGKGFAVVASEVKSLATQTAKATEEIGAKIAEMQAATATSVRAVATIGQTIGRINEIATTIASAVEEQGAATQEIARNVQQAAAGTTDVTNNISGVTQAAAQTGTAASQVLDAAGQLSKQSATLRAQVEGFLATIRAA